jgi:hypothetical protein
MRRSSLVALLAFALLLPGISAVAVPITIPTGLNTGDQYRLAFVTSSETFRDATSTDIADYNAFITGAANAVPSLLALDTTWTAIASTSTVDARDNTGTDPGTAVGVPIYLLNDTRIANNNADLWDGSIPTRLQIDQNGDVRWGVTRVWTGTGADGTASEPLGGATPRTGLWSYTTSRWIVYDLKPSTDTYSLYGISGILTVPEPSTALLLGLGLLGLGLRKKLM